MNVFEKIFLNPFLLVACGGAVGSCMRYAIGRWLSLLLPAPFPVATTCVNIIGSFLLGLVAGYVAEHRSHPVYLLLGVGLCGGFTTFSTFSMELAEQFQNGDVVFAIVECIANLVLGVLAFFAGMWFFR